jgi:serine/threonine-protein kinase RsbW
MREASASDGAPRRTFLSVSGEWPWALRGQRVLRLSTTVLGRPDLQAEADYEVQVQEQWTLFASPETASRMRGLVERFCSNGTVDPDRVHDIKVAVTEAANNAAQHAYVGRSPGPVTLVAWLESEALLLELRDEGRGMAPRIDSPGAGLGIPMMGRLADQLDITAGPGGNGTIVRMRFGAHSAGGDRP